MDLTTTPVCPAFEVIPAAVVPEDAVKVALITVVSVFPQPDKVTVKVAAADVVTVDPADAEYAPMLPVTDVGFVTPVMVRVLTPVELSWFRVQTWDDARSSTNDRTMTFVNI